MCKQKVPRRVQIRGTSRKLLSELSSFQIITVESESYSVNYHHFELFLLEGKTTQWILVIIKLYC